MPQVLLEYSANLVLPESPSDFLKKINKQIGECETFEVEKVKSRAHQLAHYCMGDGAAGKGFMYLCCAILPGRPAALKQRLGHQLLTFLKDHISSHNPGLHLHFAVHFTELNEYQVMTYEC